MPALFRPATSGVCVGRWFAGHWRTTQTMQYIGFVKEYLSRADGLHPDFQQP